MISVKTALISTPLIFTPFNPYIAVCQINSLSNSNKKQTNYITQKIMDKTKTTTNHKIKE